ncbi:MAG: VWA domain-containing protein, partial [Bacteroidales bacterium]|nr:VWA domain-containing protein [Bacteroidales bacterium]
MKKIYKSLMALAAALVLIPAAHAQDPNHEAYKFNEEKGIGYNKYLVSNTPDADGNYTLRIENFITGNVKATAVPTDFILVLDVSGSMQYDYRPRNTVVPTYIRKADNDALDDKEVLKLRLDDGQDRGHNHYGYVGTYSSGNVGATGSGGYTSIVWAYNSKNPAASTVNAQGVVTASNCGNSNRWWYYPEDETYYRLFRYAETIDGATRYYIYFDRVDPDGNTVERRYVVQGADGPTTTLTKPTNITATNTVIFIDNYNGNGYRLYRYSNRKDALKSGVNTFLALINRENKKDQWAADVTKHQVAVVSFGSQKKITDLNEATTRTANSHVCKIFREITDSNISDYEDWDATCTWQGSTFPYDGLDGAKKLFKQLQATDNMQALNAAGGTNRAKVVVVFTDGEPSNASGYTGYSNARGNINLSCQFSADIKMTGWSGTPHTIDNMNINGLVYTINLSANTDYVPDFLEHMSSNYDTGTVSNGQSG